jgi:ribosomal protein S10
MKVKISIVLKSFDSLKSDYLFLKSSFAGERPELTAPTVLPFEHSMLARLPGASVSSKAPTPLGTEASRSVPTSAQRTSCSQHEPSIEIGSSILLESTTDSLLHTTNNKLKSIMFKSNSIRLPLKHSLYTVLRSPHIDKKSREQFEMKVHKQLITVIIDIKQLREILFALKKHDQSGAQMKIVFHYTTRFPC